MDSAEDKVVFRLRSARQGYQSVDLLERAPGMRAASSPNPSNETHPRLCHRLALAVPRLAAHALLLICNVFIQ